jgi:hypothetical protein
MMSQGRKERDGPGGPTMVEPEKRVLLGRPPLFSL